MRLGDLLINNNVISEQQLIRALEHQLVHQSKLGYSLILLGFLTEQMLMRFLSFQLNMPYIEEIHEDKIIQCSDYNKLTSKVARHHCCIPIYHNDEKVVIVMSDPINSHTQEVLASCILLPYSIAIGCEGVIRKGLDSYL